MGAEDRDEQIDSLRDQVKALTEQLTAVITRLPAAPAEELVVGAPFPKTVYKEGHKKGQIDHPGVLAKTVTGPTSLRNALAEGWSEEMPELDYDKLTEEPAPAPKKGKK